MTARATSAKSGVSQRELAAGSVSEPDNVSGTNTGISRGIAHTKPAAGQGSVGHARVRPASREDTGIHALIEIEAATKASNTSHGNQAWCRRPGLSRGSGAASMVTGNFLGPYLCAPALFATRHRRLQFDDKRLALARRDERPLAAVVDTDTLQR